LTVSSDTNRFATAASIPGHRFAVTAFFSDRFAAAGAGAGDIAAGNRVAAADDKVAAAGNIADGDRVAAAGDRVAAAAVVGTFFWFSFTSNE